MTRISLTTAAAAAAIIWSPGLASAHSWYTGLYNPAGRLCCGGTDCGPVSPGLLRREADQSFSVWHGGKWYPIPMDAIMSIASPDARVHLCFWGGAPRCVFLPGGE